MAARAATKTVHSSDSKSLWNYTLSPGWTKKETEVLEAALQKWGVGCWRRIQTERVLPGKTTAQLVNQTQRLLGQQSLAEFNDLRVRLADVFAKNASKTNAKRKGGIIINSGDNPTAEETARKKERNLAKFGLTQEEQDAIVVPALSMEDSSNVLVDSAVKNMGSLKLAKLERLAMLERRLNKLRERLAEVVARKGDASPAPADVVPEAVKPAAKGKGKGKAAAKGRAKGGKAAGGARGKAAKAAANKGGSPAVAARKRAPARRKSPGASKGKAAAAAADAAGGGGDVDMDEDMRLAMRLQMEEQAAAFGGMGDSSDEDEAPAKRRRGGKARGRAR